MASLRHPSLPLLEASALEMRVKSKGRLNARFAHERKGDAIREADFLICKFLKPIQGGEFCRRVRAEDFQCAGGVNEAGFFRGKQIAGSAGQQGNRFVENKVAGEAAFVRGANFVPKRSGNPVVLVVGEVASEERARVNKGHPG